MSNIKIKTGSEGPSYDPYHYVEVTVNRVSRHFTGTITSHEGFVDWVHVDEPGKKRQVFTDIDQEQWFEVYAGITLKAARTACAELNQRKIRFHPCGQRDLNWVDGFPGEELLVCDKCKTVLHATFNLEAVR